MCRVKWRWIALIVTLGAALLTVPAGGQGEVPHPDAIIVAAVDSPETLDPAWAYDTASAEAILNVYETLIFLSGTGFELLLATEVPSQENGLIRVAADGTAYVTFPIRRGVRFSNGDPLTPEDVVYSFERLLIQDRAGGPAWMLLGPILGVDSWMEFVEGVAAELGLEEQYEGDLANFDPGDPDTYTDTMRRVDVEAFDRMAHHFRIAGHSVTIQLERPAGYFLATLVGSWAAILDREWVAEQGGWDGSAETWHFHHDPVAEESPLYDRMMGTGPYRLERWDRGNEIVLVRNEDYWNRDRLARTKYVVIKEMVSSWSTRFQMFQRGEADIVDVPLVYVGEVQPLVEAGEVNLYERLPEGAVAGAFFNFGINGESSYIGSGRLDGEGIPPDFFSDIHVRKAFTYAFDYEGEIERALMGEALRPTGPIPVGNPFYQRDIPTYSLDLEKAAEHFRRAWGGEAWEEGFTLTLVYDIGNVVQHTAYEIWKQNIESLNPKFHIDIQAEDWPRYLADLKAGNLPQFIAWWVEDFHDPHAWIQPFMASTGIFPRRQGMGLRGYAEEHWDPLIERAAASFDPAERDRIYHELEMDYYEFVPSVMLYQKVGRHYERSWLHGWFYNPGYPGIYFAPLYKEPQDHSIEVMDDTDGICVPSPMSPREGWQLVELGADSTPGMISVDRVGNGNGVVCVIRHRFR